MRPPAPAPRPAGDTAPRPAGRDTAAAPAAAPRPAGRDTAARPAMKALADRPAVPPLAAAPAAPPYGGARGGGEFTGRCAPGASLMVLLLQPSFGEFLPAAGTPEAAAPAPGR